MSMYTLLRSNKKELPSMAQVEEGFQGEIHIHSAIKQHFYGCLEIAPGLSIYFKRMLLLLVIINRNNLNIFWFNLYTIKCLNFVVSR